MTTQMDDWSLRVPTLSINPDMATRNDVARLAAELMEANAAKLTLVAALEMILDEWRMANIPTLTPKQHGVIAAALAQAQEEK